MPKRHTRRCKAGKLWRTHSCVQRSHSCERLNDVLVLDPGITLRILARVIRIQINEAALDQPVADLEHVAPAARPPIRIARAPLAVHVLAMAGALAHDR